MTLRPTADTTRVLLAFFDSLPGLSQTLNSQFHDVASVQIYRGIHSQTNSGWRSRADDVPGKQSHKLAHVRNQSSHIKDHVCGGTLLPDLSVHLQPHWQVAHIWNLVRCGEERS